MEKNWGKVESVAKYADVSKRTIEKWLKSGLKCTHLPTGLRLIKYQWVDDFLEKHTVSEDRLDQMVNDVVSKLRPN